MRERRKFVRIPEEAQISYKVLPKLKTKEYLSRNISQGGISFFVHEFIPKDSLLKIRCTIKNITFSFQAIVKVKWARETVGSDRYEVGAEFINIPTHIDANLIKYIFSVLSR